MSNTIDRVSARFSNLVARRFPSVGRRATESHVEAYRSSDGRKRNALLGRPVFLLDVVGRLSGESRPVMLMKRRHAELVQEPDGRRWWRGAGRGRPLGSDSPRSDRRCRTRRVLGPGHGRLRRIRLLQDLYRSQHPRCRSETPSELILTQTDMLQRLRELTDTASFNRWAGFEVSRVADGECELRMSVVRLVVAYCPEFAVEIVEA
jgi:F420H(2)-dependent quinone reductase